MILLPKPSVDGLLNVAEVRHPDSYPGCCTSVVFTAFSLDLLTIFETRQKRAHALTPKAFAMFLYFAYHFQG